MRQMITRTSTVSPGLLWGLSSAFLLLYISSLSELNNIYTYCCCYISPQFSGGGHLASDCDEQLIISLSFNQVCSVVGSFKTYSLDQVVKVQSLKIKAPANCGPKTIRWTFQQLFMKYTNFLGSSRIFQTLWTSQEQRLWPVFRYVGTKICFAMVKLNSWTNFIWRILFWQPNSWMVRKWSLSSLSSSRMSRYFPTFYNDIND